MSIKNNTALILDDIDDEGEAVYDNDSSSKLSKNINVTTIQTHENSNRQAKKLPNENRKKTHNSKEQKQCKKYVSVVDKSFQNPHPIEVPISQDLISPPLIECSKPKNYNCLHFSKPIDQHTAIDLRHLILGGSKTLWPEDWLQQDLNFSSNPKLCYGLIQNNEEVCGVMATLQAWLLYFLLFGDSGQSNNLNNIEKINESLISAIVHVIWKASQERIGYLLIKSKDNHLLSTVRLPHDGITEKLIIFSFKNLNDFQTCVKENLQIIKEPGGLIGLIYSVVLSRSVRTIRRDMDYADRRLLASNNSCSQELVNLFLTGIASSNTFNDSKEVNGTLLKGISERQTIGLLSYCKGSKAIKSNNENKTYLKTPKSPIWLVYLENQYSVLFSLKKALISDWKAECFFDLFYYHGFLKQNSAIRLTIVTTDSDFIPPEKDEDREDSVSPLELCIRSKWEDARVEWNDGVEPIYFNNKQLQLNVL